MEGGPGGPRLRLHRAAQHGSLPAGRPLRGKAARLPPAEGASDEGQGLKDLLDLRVILEGLADVLPSPEETRRTIMATFDRYGTHALPNPLPDPPEDWMALRSGGDEPGSGDHRHRTRMPPLKSICER